MGVNSEATLSYPAKQRNMIDTISSLSDTISFLELNQGRRDANHLLKQHKEFTGVSAKLCII